MKRLRIKGRAGSENGPEAARQSLAPQPQEQGSPSRRPAAIGIGLAAWALGCGTFCAIAAKPWSPGIAEPLCLAEPAALSIYISWGLWWGFLASGILAALLCLFRRRWMNGGDAAEAVPEVDIPKPLRPALFWGVLGLILVGAAVLRWPRMSQSFWGDEAWAFEEYVHGHWKPSVPGGPMQGPMKFRAPTWQETAFSDRGGGNNHWLFSLLQRGVLQLWRAAGHHDKWEFSESVARGVSLAAGLAGLAVLAWILHRRGHTLAGLAAAGFLTIHPWHVRFSTESRGYALMLLFLLFAIHFLLAAMNCNRLRCWVAFGLCQFGALYAWKGALYPLLGINVLAAFVLGRRAWRQLRWTSAWRWMAANALGALLFLPLYAPSHLQIVQSVAKIQNRAKPMNGAWLNNTAAEICAGTPWHRGDAQNPHEVALSSLLAAHPALWGAVAVLLAALWLGAQNQYRQARQFTGIAIAVGLSALLAISHFKWGLHIELLSWYLVYLLPTLAIQIGFSVTIWPRPWQNITTAGLVAAALTVLFLPMLQAQREHAAEDFRAAAQLTRGRHESLPPGPSSRIVTAWLWRYTGLYDPRGVRHIHAPDQLEQTLDEVRKSGGEFYMIVGNYSLARALNAELLAILEDGRQFERREVLWAQEFLHTLRIFRWRQPPPLP